MAAAMGYAMRRTSARLVLAFVAGGLVLVVYRALRPMRLPHQIGMGGPIYYPAHPAPLLPYAYLRSSTWDLAAGSLFMVVALVVAAFLWYERPARR